MMLSALLLLTQLTVACLPEDSLRPLAEEIAAQEHAPIVSSWTSVRGEFLVWVVEPSRLSDDSIVEFAAAWRDRFPEVAVGLISGWTRDQAKALWKRSSQVRPHPATAFDTRQPVERERFLAALESGGYVTFAGHGGQSYLRLNSGWRLTLADLPETPGLVIGTASCNVFRPWDPDSIAMAFVERGAAAFAGFVYSPNAGYLIGCYDGLPFGQTYPGFPIGRVVQLQNQSAMQAFAALPYYLLMGDPRIALQSKPSWLVSRDEVLQDSRQIILSNAPPGFLPLRIPNGAAYHLVEASGTGAASEYDFYNSRLQARAFGSDLFVLIRHTGGPLTVRLRKQTPAWWLVRHSIADALDNALISLPSEPESGLILLWFGMLSFVGAFRRRLPRNVKLAGAVAAIAAALFQAVWIWTRAANITVSSKSPLLNPLAITGTLFLTGGAAIIFVRAKTRRCRAAAVVLAALPAWLPALFQFIVITAANKLVFRPRIGVPIYNIHVALTAACAAGLIIISMASLFNLLARLARRHPEAK
jgi:hypothetical protein